MAELTVTAPGCDPDQFKEAMSRFVAAVNIVTTDGPAGLGGITATAVTSVTVDPPMMLFCINKSSPSAARIIANGVFCINTLAPQDEALSNVFAGRTHEHLEERFRTGAWTKLETGAPALATALASFDCRIVEVKEISSHFVLIGAVESVAYSTEEESLAYGHRRYIAIRAPLPVE